MFRELIITYSEHLITLLHNLRIGTNPIMDVLA